MKKNILLFVFLGLFGIGAKTVQAQQGYYSYNEPGRHYTTTTVLPTVDGGLLVAVGDVNAPYSSLIEDSPAKIIKLSEHGEETDAVYLSDGVYSYVIDLFEDPTNSKFYYAIGKIHDLESQCEKPYLVHFDGELNILSQATIDLPEECRYLTDVSTLLAEDGCIYWVSSCQTVFPSMPFNSSAQVYMRINLDGELEKMELDNDHPGGYCFSGDIFPYRDGSGDFGHLYTTADDYTGSHNTLIRFTRDLELSLVYMADGTPPINEPYGNMTYSVFPPCESQSTLTLPDGKLLYTDQVTEAIWGDDYYWIQSCSPMLKIDLEQFQILQYLIIGRENDSTEKAPAKHAIDFVKPDELFHCCYAFIGMDAYWYLPKRIMVTKTDADLNVTWTRYFFEGQYYPTGVKAAEDGGCWVYGFLRANGDVERTAFVFRLNAEGMLGMSESGIEIRPYCFYPNPVQAQLQMQFSPDVLPNQVELYDLQGRLMRTQRSHFGSIDMSQLPAGTYTMRVTLEDGTVFSDKVVKE